MLVVYQKIILRLLSFLHEYDLILPLIPPLFNFSLDIVYRYFGLGCLFWELVRREASFFYFFKQ